VAIIANTYQTYQAKGIREELSDVITNISPTETPFISNAGKGKVSNTFYEWQTDALASVDPTNKQIKKAGRKSEMAYQLAKKGAELKRDIETIALSNQAMVSGARRRRPQDRLGAGVHQDEHRHRRHGCRSGVHQPADAGSYRRYAARRGRVAAQDVLQKCWTQGASCRP
jgi:hypothetical protein